MRKGECALGGRLRLPYATDHEADHEADHECRMVDLCSLWSGLPAADVSPMPVLLSRRERLMPEPEYLSDEELNRAEKMVGVLANYIWTKSTRPGDHIWSIPADESRDFDCLFSRALQELRERRDRETTALVAADVVSFIRQRLRAMGCEYVGADAAPAYRQRALEQILADAERLEATHGAVNLPVGQEE